MAVETLPRRPLRETPILNDGDSEPTGVPPPGRLGVARSELVYLVIGLLAFAAILIAFWYEATHG